MPDSAENSLIGSCRMDKTYHHNTLSQGFNRKNFAMILNSRLQTVQVDEKSTPALLIHGLFGSLDNLGVLARALKPYTTVLQVDVRNHGLSPRETQMDYAAMARDMLETLDAHGLEQVDVIGHSMGGKIAMALAALVPERVKRLVIIDIAPVNYQTRRHDEIFAALNAVTQRGITTREEATRVMQPILKDELVVGFLLKSFRHGEWLFNVAALWDNYTTISGWQPVAPCQHPALFIRGAQSSYLDSGYRDALLAQFPHARAHIIAGAGHWVHAEKPQAVVSAALKFLGTQGFTG